MYLDSKGDVKVGKVARHVIGFLIFIIFAFGSWGIVSAGERGVKVRLGVIQGVVEPGPYLKLPLIERVVKMDVRTQSLVADKSAPLSAASNDLQDVKLAVVVNYRINSEMAADIYQNYRSTENYYGQVVEPLIVATIKATASQYTAAEQIQKRLEMQSRVMEALTVAFEGKGVVVDKADITDIGFSDAFTKAIEEKVTAVQNAETQKNKLEQTKYEAEQRIAQARGEAEAIRIQAQAITQQGGEDYVRLKTIEKWNGVGCTSYCSLETSNGLLIQAR